MIEKFIMNALFWLENQNGIVIWIFFSMSNFLENVFPPWPGDTVTVFGGFMLAHSAISLAELVSATVFGNLAGGIVMYLSGKRILHWMEHHDFPLKKSFYSQEQIHKTFQWFHKNSILVVVLSRFSAGIRFFVSIIAGMSHYPLLSFLIFFTLAIILWCGLLIAGGYTLGKNWEYILQIIQLYNRTVLILIVSGIIAYFLFFRKKKNS